MKKSNIVSAFAMVFALAVAGSAEAAPVTLDISGTLNTIGAYTGTLNLDVTGGFATSGTGTLNMLSNSYDLVLITTATPGNDTGGGMAAPIGFRANDGTDYYAFDNALPLTGYGMLFAIDVEGYVPFPTANHVALLGLYVDGGPTAAVTGKIGGNEYYNQTGSLTISQAAVPEPASWALMIAGFGLAGAAMRGRARKMAAAIG